MFENLFPIFLSLFLQFFLSNHNLTVQKNIVHNYCYFIIPYSYLIFLWKSNDLCSFSNFSISLHPSTAQSWFIFIMTFFIRFWKALYCSWLFISSALLLLSIKFKSLLYIAILIFIHTDGLVVLLKQKIVEQVLLY